MNNFLAFFVGTDVDRKAFPFYLVWALCGLGILVIFHGVNWYLLYYAGGFLVGIPILDLDRFIAPKLDLIPSFFHSFKIFVLTGVLAVFVITSSGSVFGAGMVMAILMHGWIALVDKRERQIGLAILGVALLLLIR